MVDAERPLLEAHGLSMWDYIVLSQLAGQPADTQLALAQAIRYDKTRLIGLLDRLEDDGLIARKADPTDRRARAVTLTEAGHARHAAARADIRALEEEFLADLNPCRTDPPAPNAGRAGPDRREASAFGPRHQQVLDAARALQRRAGHTNANHRRRLRNTRRAALIEGLRRP